MISELQQLDTEWFLQIHRGMANPFFDWLMPLVRNKYFWSPLYLFIIVFCIRQYGKTGYFMIVGLLATFALGDLTASKIIKPAVERIRPCNDPALQDQLIRRVVCGSGYSFPSAHATNHFGLAVFIIGLFYRKWKAILPIGLSWAALISFAQLYVGVHYPIDIFVGLLLGTLLGGVTSFVFKRIYPEY